MRTTHLNLLQALGIDRRQAAVYLAVLELGEPTIAQVAKRAHLKRTSLYYLLRQLERQGLVHREKVAKRTLLVAEDPENLLKQYEDRVGQLKSVLPSLKSVQNRPSHRSRMLFFDTFEGFKQIWRHLFSSGEKEYLIISDPREMLQYVRKQYITGRLIREKIRLGIHSRHLMVRSEYAKMLAAKQRDENRETRLLPAGQQLTTTMIIFGNRVALIAPIQEDLIVIIESDAFAQSMRTLFGVLWNHLE